MSAAIAAGVIGTVGAGVIAADAAKDAGKAAERGAKAAAGVSERQFDISNNLTANQRQIGNQALNALGARYGFNPAAGFENATYNPYNLSPDKTSRGVGAQVLGQADVRELIKKGVSIDDILKIGVLDPNTDGKKLTGLNLDPRDLQRLKSGTFSEGYQAANRPQVATGTGIPSQFNPTPIAGATGQQFMGGSATNPSIDGNRSYAATFTDAQLQDAIAKNQPGSEVRRILDEEVARRRPIDPNAPTSNLDRLRELAMTDPDLKRLSGPVDYSLNAFEASPDYQFRLNEGLKSVQNSAAARGGLFSGNALRGITDYASNLASGEYNDFVGRAENKRGQEFTRRLGLLESDFGRQSQFDQLQRNFADSDFNRIANLAGIGTTATQQLNGIGVQTAGNIGNALTAAGNARASGIIGQGNALLGTAGNLADIAGYFSNRGSGVNNLQSLDYRGNNSGVRFA